MSEATESGDGIEINGVAHVVLRVNRIAECIEFYDRLMPFLGLRAVPPRSEEFVYYVGGRTALAVRVADPEQAATPTSRPGRVSTTSASGRGGARTSTPSLVPSRPAPTSSAPPEEGPWAPGYYSLSFRDPEGIRLELNHVPGPGLLGEDASFKPIPDYPLEGGG